MKSSRAALKAQLPKQTSDQRQQQACLAQHVQQLQQLAPEAIKDDAARIELLEQLQESLSSANALVDIVAEQQRLTGEDPLTPAAYAAALNAKAEEEAEETSDVDLEAFETEPDSYGEELNSESKQTLMRVMGVVDALDRSQLLGLAHLAKCHPHQVRSIFSELRTKLRNSTTAAARRASKASVVEAAEQTAAAEQATHLVGSLQNEQQQGLQQMVSAHPGYYQPSPYMQQQQQQPGSGSRTTADGSQGAAAAAEHVAGASGGSSPKLGPTCSRLAVSIAEQKEKLAKVLDKDTGAIVSGGRFLGLLGLMTSWAGRVAALTALAASCNTKHAAAAAAAAAPHGSRSGGAGSTVSGGGMAGRGASAAVRAQLVSSRLLDVLEGWLAQARRDKQVTVMRQLLQVLPHIGLSAALLQSSGLAAEVAELHGHPHPAVAAAAQAATQAWAVAAGQVLPGGAGGTGRQCGGQQNAAPNELIPCGGGHKVTAGYKRKTTLAIKRHIEELALAGDLKRHQPATAAAAAGKLAAAATAAAVQSGDRQEVAAAVAGNVGNAAIAGNAGNAAAGSSFKRPSKRVVQPAAAAAAKGAANAPMSDAARRLVALHSLSSSKGASGQPRQQQQQQHKSIEQLWAELPQQQRLHALAPHGRAPAAFLAASGAFAAEVTQAVQSYDRAVQAWKQQRCAAAAKEQQAAAAAMAVLHQPQQLSSTWQRCLVHAETPAWAESPPLVLDSCFDSIPGGWAAGQDSQLASATAADWRQQFKAISRQQQGEQTHEPLEPAAAAAAGGGGGGGGGQAAAGSTAAAAVRRIPLNPTDAAEAVKERVRLWIAGVRLPSHLARPPSTSEVTRVRQELFPQEYPQQQQQQQVHYQPQHTSMQQHLQSSQRHALTAVPGGQQPLYQQPPPQLPAVQYYQPPPQQAVQHVVFQQPQQQQFAHVPPLLPVQATPQHPQMVVVQPQLQQLSMGYMPAQQLQPHLQQQQQHVVYMVPARQPPPQQVVHVVHHLTKHPQQQQQPEPYEHGYFPQGH